MANCEDVVADSRSERWDEDDVFCSPDGSGDQRNEGDVVGCPPDGSGERRDEDDVGWK